MKTVTDKAKKISESFKDEFGDNLSSIHLYGSAARGEYIPGKSDLNLLLVFERLDKETLKKISTYQSKYTGKVSFICLTKDYIDSSDDSFPIELLDMKLHHEVLYGEDRLAGIEIVPEHLRIQLERELKAKLTLLRQGLIIHGFREKDLNELMIQHLPALAAIFQGLIYLEGENVPVKRSDLYKLIADKFALQPEFINELLRITRKDRFGISIKIEDLFFKIIELIEKLSRYIDNLEFK